MTSVESAKRVPKILSFAFFLAFGFSFFFVDLGFALKPYMIVVLLIFAYVFYHILHRNTQLHRPTAYEYIFVIFFMLIGVSMFHSIYPLNSFRFSVNALLIVFSYFVLRVFFLNFVTLQDIKRTAARAGIVIAIASLAFYIAGAYNLSFNFIGNGIDSYGITIDRSTPRLMGVVTIDPNLTAAFLSILFLFLLPDKRYVITKLLLALTILLTFSRGAYLAIGAALLIYFMLNVRKLFTARAIRLIVICSVIGVVSLSLLSNLANVNVADIATGRVDDASLDNGSGRLDIWRHAIDTFTQAPLFGIGANSSLQYNIDHYGEFHYVHNTYIEILSELGLIGASVYLLLIITIFYAAIACYQKGEQGPLIVLIALLIQMGFLSMMTSEAFMVALLFLTVSLHYTYRMPRPQNRQGLLLKGSAI